MKDFKIKDKQAMNYFKDIESEASQTEKIELNFDLINGKPNFSYTLHLKNQDLSDNNSISSKSIIISNANQSVNLLKYNCDYSFGKEQKLDVYIEIKDSNNSGNYPINMTIGEIIGNENSSKLFYIKGNNEEEILEVKAKKMDKKIKYLTIHFNIKITNPNISNEEKDSYFCEEKNKIYFTVEQDKKRLYESETYTDDGKFNMVQIPLNILKQEFSIAFYNWKNKCIGELKTNVDDLSDQNKNGNIFFTKQISLDSKLNIYNYSSIKDEITFFDYINKGVKIALDIGIDFTGSNGMPDEKDSLHYWGEGEKRNPYERAILSCASIMANYDYDQLFPVYGFGAKIKGQGNKVNHCFNINFKEDPNIQFVENIVEEYHKCLDKIYFSHPTYFAPIINKIIEEIKRQDDMFEYHVLMILTDGVIDDLKETIDALVEGSFYPLSVIIIGIGDKEDFSKMEQLDGDEIPLISSKGIKRQRDLVQFVPFYKFEMDEVKLSQEVLDEIPRQVIEYYSLNFLYPETLTSKGSNFMKEIDKTLTAIGSYNPLQSGFKIGNNTLIQTQNENENKEYSYSEIDKKFSGSIKYDDPK